MSNIEIVSKLLSLRFLQYDNTEGGYTAIFTIPGSNESVRLPRKLIEHIANKFNEIEVLNVKVKTILK